MRPEFKQSEKKENAKPTDDIVALASTRLALNQVSSCRCVITNVGVDRNNAFSLERPGFTLAIVKPSIASTGRDKGTEDNTYSASGIFGAIGKILARNSSLDYRRS